MAKMPKQVMDLINDPDAVKFLATIDDEGKPNCALIASLSAASEDTLIFADLMMNKTKKNLISTRRVAATVYKAPWSSYQIKGTFEGFQSSGFLYDMAQALSKESPLLKGKVYFYIKQIGVIKVDEVYLSQVPIPGKRIA
ncbi:MAG TPA: pyridoxamine 5'-phosphate oxidase family protein [Dehalococcoidia bacterium]|nr:pyridoxamine 5'-phosphate oxidase family protein [Dehalococcoidia bacterium]